MVQNRKLHILNGQAMYNHFAKIHFLEQEMKIPFNEAMCYGNTPIDIFSHEFIEIRSKVHHVTPEKYAEVTLKPLQPLLNKRFIHFVLWFDADMFCQINILTILAWLDQINHNVSIELHIVDDKFEPVENYTLQAQGYYELYKQVLIHKTMPKSIYPAPLRKGVKLYLDYLKQDSDIMLYIQENQNVPERELVALLLKEFREYGLGDKQYIEMIKKYQLSNNGLDSV
jgi:hypothetical protein